MARRRDPPHDGRHAAHAFDDLDRRRAGLAHERATGFDLDRRIVDQRPDVLGRRRRTLGEPARAASAAAFNARILVWNAIPSITAMMSMIFLDDSLIELIISTICDTTEPPRILIAPSEKVTSASAATAGAVMHLGRLPRRDAGTPLVVELLPGTGIIEPFASEN